MENKKKKSFWSKNLKWIIAGAIILIAILDLSLGSKTETKQYTLSEKQKDFLKVYTEINETVYAVKKAAYVSNNLRATTPITSLYNTFKESEELYKNCSVVFTFSNFTLPKSLKEFEEEFEQSFKELSTACIILQDYAKYTADFINTNDLESSRKAEKILEQKPLKLISNAVSRLVFGVGKKIELDTDSLKEEYESLSTRIEQEFQAEIRGSSK